MGLPSLTQPSNMPNQLWKLVQDCINNDTPRPSMHDVEQRLIAIGNEGRELVESNTWRTLVLNTATWYHLHIGNTIFSVINNRIIICEILLDYLAWLTGIIILDHEWTWTRTWTRTRTGYLSIRHLHPTRPLKSTLGTACPLQATEEEGGWRVLWTGPGFILATDCRIATLHWGGWS